MAIRVIGLTGGIGSGKSTVAAMFRKLGAEVIDADRLARDVVAAGTPALAEIVATFGQEVLAPDGTLDRGRLGQRVFGDELARKRLENIVHPRIREAATKEIHAAEAKGCSLVLYEAALLVEVGLYKNMDGLIVVTAPETVQVARALARGGLSEEEIKKRMAAQLSTAKKAAEATHVIDNGGSLEATQKQVEEVWEKISKAPSSNG